jgi:molybdopterin-synthase adenylyltransferase
MKNADRIRFAKIGEKGDEKLKNCTVAILGLGSVGSTAAAMLSREDISLRLIDQGRVEEQDMHRLDLFLEEDITKFKVKQAKARIAAVNPNLAVKSFHEEMGSSNIFLMEADVLLDTSNSDELNAITASHAAKKKKPLVLVRSSGSKANILVLHKAAPAKLLQKVVLPSVEKVGAFGPMSTIAAGVAVAETLKILLGDKSNKLIEIDGWDAKAKITKI